MPRPRWDQLKCGLDNTNSLINTYVNKGVYNGD